MAVHPKLKAFIDDLLNEPAKWARFRTSPEAVANEAGLTPEELDLLQNGPKDKLLDALGKTDAGFTAYMIW